MLEQSKKPVAFVVELLNVGSKLIHKQGILTLFQLSDEAMAMGTVDIVALKAEWPAGSFKANATELVVSAKAKLDLMDKGVQSKINQVLDASVKGVGLADEVLSYVKELKEIF